MRNHAVQAITSTRHHTFQVKALCGTMRSDGSRILVIIRLALCCVLRFGTQRILVSMQFCLD